MLKKQPAMPMMARCTLGRVFTLVLFSIALTLLLVFLSDYTHPQEKRDLLPPAKAPKVYKPLQKGLPVLNQNATDGVRTFVFFIGYPRSGHSIVASCLDAHPDAVVAHEFSLFAKLLQPKLLEQLKNRTVLYSSLYQNSLRQSQTGWRSGQASHKGLKGYTLKINSSESWQGKVRHLTVIGDKSGGLTSHTYRDSPKQFMSAYKELSKIVRVPIKVLHVVRNPFDIVATKLLYRLSDIKGRRGNFSHRDPVTQMRSVMQAIKALESEAKAVREMVEKRKLDTLEIHNEEFISDTKGTMQKICQFLGLECSDAYLKMCDDAAYDEPSRTRSAVIWNQASRSYVEDLIKQYPFFSKYSLNS